MKDEFHLSPDGQVIAYGDNRAGTWEVFVASFPSFHDIKQVSLAGGVLPRWRGDGKELFFIDPQGKMMSATVERGAAPKIGIPRKLFDTMVKTNALGDLGNRVIWRLQLLVFSCVRVSCCGQE